MYKRRFCKRFFPTKQYVIQGILKPQRTIKEKKQAVEKCQLRKKVEANVKICSACDFQDKQFGYCLIKRLGSICPYTNNSTGYVAFKLLQQ